MNLFRKLWKDDQGVVTLEYLVLGTILALGLIVGVTAVEGALNVELTELANAILALSQEYSSESQSNCKAFKEGSATSDAPSSIGFDSTAVAGTDINETVCP
jgi:Flp pilus assembly pilin Flp